MEYHLYNKDSDASAITSTVTLFLMLRKWLWHYELLFQLGDFFREVLGTMLVKCRSISSFKHFGAFCTKKFISICWPLLLKSTVRILTRWKFFQNSFRFLRSREFSVSQLFEKIRPCKSCRHFGSQVFYKFLTSSQARVSLHGFRNCVPRSWLARSISTKLSDGLQKSQEKHCQMVCRNLKKNTKSWEPRVRCLVKWHDHRQHHLTQYKNWTPHRNKTSFITSWTSLNQQQCHMPLQHMLTNQHFQQNKDSHASHVWVCA